MTDPKVLAKLRELEGKATPPPWTVWDSCSFRRISHKGDGDVICGITQRSDGHPDLHARREDLDFLCELRNHAAALLSDSERLAEAEKKIRELSLELHSCLTQLAQPHEDPRLRLAVEGLEDIAEGDPFRNLPHIARDIISRLEIRST